jgi:hypothetical protein
MNMEEKEGGHRIVIEYRIEHKILKNRQEINGMELFLQQLFCKFDAPVLGEFFLNILFPSPH